jgi:hypothetical protein
MSKNAASSSAEASVAAGATAVLVSALRFQRAAAVAAATPELAFQLSYAFGVIRFGGILRAPLASSVRTSFLRPFGRAHNVRHRKHRQGAGAMGNDWPWQAVHNAAAAQRVLRPF